MVKVTTWNCGNNDSGEDHKKFVERLYEKGYLVRHCGSLDHIGSSNNMSEYWGTDAVSLIVMNSILAVVEHSYNEGSSVLCLQEFPEHLWKHLNTMHSASGDPKWRSHTNFTRISSVCRVTDDDGKVKYVKKSYPHGCLVIVPKSWPTPQKNVTTPSYKNGQYNDISFNGKIVRPGGRSTQWVQFYDPQTNDLYAVTSVHLPQNGDRAKYIVEKLNEDCQNFEDNGCRGIISGDFNTRYDDINKLNVDNMVYSDDGSPTNYNPVSGFHDRIDFTLVHSGSESDVVTVREQRNGIIDPTSPFCTLAINAMFPLGNENIIVFNGNQTFSNYFGPNFMIPGFDHVQITTEITVTKSLVNTFRTSNMLVIRKEVKNGESGKKIRSLVNNVCKAFKVSKTCKPTPKSNDIKPLWSEVVIRA